MKAGEAVVLHGLYARSDLNRRTGVLVQWLDVGRWVVEMDNSREMLRLKPENLTLLAAPINGRRIAIGSAQLTAQEHRKFVAVVQKYSFDRGTKSDEVADYVTSRETSAAMTSADLSARFGTSEEEAEAFLAWLNVGIAFKEWYLAQESDAPSLLTTSSDSSLAADAAVSSQPAAASRALSAGAGVRLQSNFAAVSLPDDLIAE